jgi:predicted ABC-type ATPase
VEAGGHAVPPGAVRRRYRRSLGNLPEAIQRADETMVYDNSGRQPRLVLQAQDGGRVTWVSSGALPAWVEAALGKNPHVGQHFG